MTDNNEVRGKAVKKYVSTSSHGGMVAVVSNDYSGTYVSHDDYAALQAEAEALRVERDRMFLSARDWATRSGEQEARAERLAEALRAYRESEWSPVANYSDDYWYMAGKPWEPAEAALDQEGKRDE